MAGCLVVGHQRCDLDADRAGLCCALALPLASMGGGPSGRGARRLQAVLLAVGALAARNASVARDALVGLDRGGRDPRRLRGCRLLRPARLPTDPRSLDGPRRRSELLAVCVLPCGRGVTRW